MTATPILTIPGAELYATHAEWLAARRPGVRIGASIVGRILTRPWEALEILTGQAPPPDAATQRAYDRGHRFEPVVLSEYEAITGRPGVPIGAAVGAPGSLVIVPHPTEPWLCASPDGGTLDPEHGAGLIEAKTAGSDDIHWQAGDTEIPSVAAYDVSLCPPIYYTQCLVQLACTGLPYVDLACLMPRYDLRVVRVWADPDTQAEILDTVGEWRERHLIRGESLPVDGSDACTRLLTRRFPGVGKEIRPATTGEADIVRRYVEARARAKVADDEADELRNVIASALGDTYGLSLGGKSKVLLIPTAGRRTIDGDALRAAHPDIAERFTRAGAPYRQLRTYGLD